MSKRRVVSAESLKRRLRRRLEPLVLYYQADDRYKQHAAGKRYALEILNTIIREEKAKQRKKR